VQLPSGGARGPLVAHWGRPATKTELSLS
jgi:hypothetical protein